MRHHRSSPGPEVSPERESASSGGGRVAVFLGSLLVALVLAELALRLIPADRDTFEHRMHRIPHPALGWALEPAAVYTYRPGSGEGGRAVRVEYNSAGWRDVEHEVRRPAGVFRILVLGDSFMEAYSVDLEDAFARQLGARGRELGLDVEVLNFGVGGYGTLQSYLALRERGLAYEPDLVLLGFYVLNDVHENSPALATAGTRQALRGGARPFVELAEGGDWSITAIDYEAALDRYESQRLGGDATSLRLWQLIRRAFSRPRDTPRALVHGCTEDTAVADAWRVTGAILERLRDASSAPFLLFTVPGLAEVDVGVARERWGPDSVWSACYEDLPGYRRLRDASSSLGIPLIDLLPAFRAEGAGLFHRSDLHWNESGHARAADVVLDALVAGGWLPTSG